MRSRKRYHRKSNIKHDAKIALGVLAVAALGYGAYYLYQKNQASTAQLPPAGGSAPSGG